VYLGVDEAGKGPVLGPMVAAAVLAVPSSLPADVDDSKRLLPERREAMAEAIRERDDVAVGVAFVEPAEIDRPDTDMNTLTVRGQARAVRTALGGSLAAAVDEPVRVVADAGDTDEARFARRLAESVEGESDGLEGESDGLEGESDGLEGESDGLEGESDGLEGESDGLEGAGDDPEGEDVADRPAVAVEAHHGADADDPVVGAASVVAKAARDARMAAIDADYPEYGDLGSGYPSDPATRSFLREYAADRGTVPDCARRSWATCDDVLAAAEQAALDEF
jgi:ribonuclease HII